MKKLKIYLMFLAVFGLLITSCSRDEETVNNDKLASLSFTTVLNDFVSSKAQLKQQLEVPDCSDEAPAYVAVVLTGAQEVGSTDNPVVVAVNTDLGNFDDDPETEYFTEESSELELIPGEYTLEYFTVYNGIPGEDGTEVIWVAPRNDGSMADFVNAPLPMTFDLGPGAKKYVDVEVLCFDDRIVNEYGYVFFELGTTRAIEFCLFGNYCDSIGRHFPASYSVDVWQYSNGERGELIYSDLQNSLTVNNDGDYTASPLCMALPDTEGGDQYYFEITLLDSEAYGDVDLQPTIIRTGVISDTQVKELFGEDSDSEYYHFREGNCDSTDTPNWLTITNGTPEPDGDDMDGDGIVDSKDNCPETANPGQEDFDDDGIGDVCDPDIDGDGIPNETDECNETPAGTSVGENGCPKETETPDDDGDGIPNEEDNCVGTANPDQEDFDKDGVGDACDPDIDGDGIENDLDNCAETPAGTDVDENGCPVESDRDGDGIPDSSDNCPDIANPGQEDMDNDGIGDVCDPDRDGDGEPNDTDNCPDDAPDVDVDGDGCEDIPVLDSDGDGVPDTEDSCPEGLANVSGEGCLNEVYIIGSSSNFFELGGTNTVLDLTANGTHIGDGTVEIEGDDVLVKTTLTAQGGYLYEGFEIYISSAASGEQIFSACNPDTDSSTSLNNITTFSNVNLEFPIFIRIKANLCPALD